MVHRIVALKWTKCRRYFVSTLSTLRAFDDVWKMVDDNLVVLSDLAPDCAWKQLSAMHLATLPSLCKGLAPKAILSSLQLPDWCET